MDCTQQQVFINGEHEVRPLLQPSPPNNSDLMEHHFARLSSAVSIPQVQVASSFNFTFSTSNPETKIADLEFKSKRISPETSRFCFIANIEQDTYELVMRSISTLLTNNNCDLLVDLGSKWLEESKDLKQI